MTPTKEPAAPAELADLRRGDVVEIIRGKPHPWIVISADVMNRTLKSIIVVPLTSQKPGQGVLPHEVLISPPEGGLTQNSIAQPQYLTCLDRYEHVTKVGGRVSEHTLTRITASIMVVIGRIPTG